ncbi:MAG: TMEM165/GDT1 family protein [Deltaproteobacteria bacterium]|nr:TMEM165/GDT1 family protein [Deltaproteobacteria bacterium]
MSVKLFLTVFTTVFLAEMADKTQLATFLYAAESGNNKMTVFIGSAAALVCASALAVFLGSVLSSFLNEKIMGRVAGAAFILVGIWTIARS